MTKLTGNPWAVLATLSLGFFMTLLDLTIVNIAIPDIQSGLHASLDQVLWTISGYALILAVALITAARLGDRYGQRRLFSVGVLVFTVASAGCGLAPGIGWLIGARVVQGLGAALLVPQTMAMIIAVFPAARRGTAMGIWGAVAGVASLSGPSLGGLLVSTVGWRWVFIVNVPIGILLLALTALIVPDVRTGRSHRFDLAGVVLASATLFCLTFGLMEGERFHWGAGIWALLAAGAGLFATFLLHQRARQDREPLIPFELFRDRNFTVMTVLVALVSIALLGVVLPMSIYLQSVLGMSALQAGLTLAPSPLVSLWVSPLAGRMSDRIGGRRILFAGLLAYAAGIVAIGILAGTGSHWYTFTAALAVMGFGVGCMIAPLATEAMRNVPPRLAGAASGVNNTVRQIGSVIGSAVVGAVMQSRLATELASGASYADGFVATLHVTFALPVAVLLLGAAACALVRDPMKQLAAAA